MKLIATSCQHLQWNLTSNQYTDVGDTHKMSKIQSENKTTTTKVNVLIQHSNRATEPYIAFSVNNSVYSNKF